MEVICLREADHRLLCARCAEHGNSQRRLQQNLKEAGAEEVLEHARALRRMERAFDIDLGSLCHRFEHRDDLSTHPMERMVMNFVAEWRPVGDGTRQLWVLLDRLRQVRELMREGQMAREPES